MEIERVGAKRTVTIAEYVPGMETSDKKKRESTNRCTGPPVEKTGGGGPLIYQVSFGPSGGYRRVPGVPVSAVLQSSDGR